MQDLSRFQKKDHIEIRTKYVSLLLFGSVALVGLVFALGVLVGGRNAPVEKCDSHDPLAALDIQSGEPSPPDMGEVKFRTFHETLDARATNVPTLASLGSISPVIVEKPMVLERPRHEESPIPEKVSDMDPGTYSLQVASFRDQREATIMISRLKRAGHKSFLVSVNMPERGGLWYRVRVGPFQSKKNVWNYKKIFEKKEKLATFVVKLRSEV
jgi:hypothetical protein